MNNDKICSNPYFKRYMNHKSTNNVQQRNSEFMCIISVNPKERIVLRNSSKEKGNSMPGLIKKLPEVRKT